VKNELGTLVGFSFSELGGELDGVGRFGVDVRPGREIGSADAFVIVKAASDAKDLEAVSDELKMARRRRKKEKRSNASA
jgi:hypothetical protein